MRKLGRTYTLYIQTKEGGTLTVTPPFTIEFDITRNTLTSANVCSIRIYNLSKNNRNQLRFNVMDTGVFQSFIFLAGYGNEQSVVFSGNISQAWSVREGVNFITNIECFDGGYAFNNGKVGTTFPTGTLTKTIFSTVSATMPNLSIGSVSSAKFADANGSPESLKRDNPVDGNSLDILTSLSGNGFFVDNGKINCLGDSECVPGGLDIVNDAAGLLATPIREVTKLTFDMLFEPRVLAGQLLNLQSSEGAANLGNFNGAYKVTGIKHRGMISDAVCGDAITSIEMFYGQALTVVQP